MRKYFYQRYAKFGAVIINEKILFWKLSEVSCCFINQKMLFWNLYKVSCCYHEWEHSFLKVIWSFLLEPWMRKCFSEIYTKLPAVIMKEKMLFWKLYKVSCWYHEGGNAFLKLKRSFMLVSWRRKCFSESYTKFPAGIMNENILFWKLYEGSCCYHEWENAFLKLIQSLLLLSWMRKCFSETYRKFLAVIMNEKMLFWNLYEVSCCYHEWENTFLIFYSLHSPIYVYTVQCT